MATVIVMIKVRGVSHSKVNGLYSYNIATGTNALYKTSRMFG